MGKFEVAVKSSKVTGDYLPAYGCFANTKFYVAVVRLDSGAQTSEFCFVVKSSPEDQGRPCVLISEELSRLEGVHSSDAILLSGGKLVELLNPEIGILVALGDGAFGMPVDIVRWLRGSIQPAQ
jgi:hypothetical protein